MKIYIIIAVFTTVLFGCTASNVQQKSKTESSETEHVSAGSVITVPSKDNEYFNEFISVAVDAINKCDPEDIYMQKACYEELMVLAENYLNIIQESDARAKLISFKYSSALHVKDFSEKISKWEAEYKQYIHDERVRFVSGMVDNDYYMAKNYYTSGKGRFNDNEEVIMKAIPLLLRIINANRDFCAEIGDAYKARELLAMCDGELWGWQRESARSYSLTKYEYLPNFPKMSDAEMRVHVNRLYSSSNKNESNNKDLSLR